MYPLVESLAVKNGEILNIPYHEKRFESSYLEYYKHKPSYSLFDDLALKLPLDGYHKLRILYNETSKHAEISPYRPQNINTLRCVEDDSIDYHIKYTDRQLLQELFAHRMDCDDILIVKQGYISDTFSGNILFFNGKEWHTPDTPLLKGTQRAKLLDEKKIQECPIRLADLSIYNQFMVINAMRPFDLDIAADISGIE